MLERDGNLLCQEKSKVNDSDKDNIDEVEDIRERNDDEEDRNSEDSNRDDEEGYGKGNNAEDGDIIDSGAENLSYN